MRVMRALVKDDVCKTEFVEDNVCSESVDCGLRV